RGSLARFPDRRFLGCPCGLPRVAERLPWGFTFWSVFLKSGEVSFPKMDELGKQRRPAAGDCQQPTAAHPTPLEGMYSARRVGPPAADLQAIHQADQSAPRQPAGVEQAPPPELWRRNPRESDRR